MNEALIVSDGIEARIGALTAQPISPPAPVALLAAWIERVHPNSWGT